MKATAPAPSAPFNYGSNMLADENRRILDAVRALLKHLLIVDYSFQKRSLKHLQPVLQVRLWNLRGFSIMASADIRARFDVVARYSRRLNFHLDLKADFWIQILTSKMMCRRSIGDPTNNGRREIKRTVERWIVQNGYELRISLEFQHKRVETNCMDALLEFIITRIESMNGNPEENALLLPNTIAFGLSFYHCRMKRTELVMIEQLLDQIFAHPDCQFSIGALDLSENEAGGPELAVVTSILKKKNVYRTHGISTVLRATLDHHGATSMRDLENPLETSNAASFRKILLCNNFIGVEQYAVIGSALGYGCASEELSLEDTIYHPYSTKSDRMQCWRWLAFGLFYPRSRRFDNNGSYKLCKIQLPVCDYADVVEGFTKAFENPVGELLYGASGESAVDESLAAVSTTKLMIYSVKKDVNVYAALMSTARVVLILDKTSEIEALREQNNWVCVVIPGFGRGWVPADQVVVLEQESAAGSVLKYDLEMSTILRRDYNARDLVSFIKFIGSQLSTLDLRDKQANQRALVITVVTHYVNVE